MTPTEKLIQLLAEQGFYVESIRSAKGHWRKTDVYRWEASALPFRDDGTPDYRHFCRFQLGSWDTITECVKHGIVLVKDPSLYGHYEVWSQKSAKNSDEIRGVVL